MAQSNTPSILERVQRVEDPELAELIRLTMESREDLGQKEILEITYKVTLSYVQIKLFDQQIAEVSRKIKKAETGPAEMQYELLLAKTELEAKQMTELANLRELMGITPRHAFEKQPIETLNAQISLQVIGERVYVLNAQKPFEYWWAKRRWKSVGLLSEKETLDYIRGKLKDKDSLPIRFHIHYNPETKSASESLRSKIISMARETNSQMHTEVRLEQMESVGSGTSTFFIREGTIRTLYPHPVRRPDRGPEPLTTGLVEPNDLEQHILWRLLMPGNVPLTFRIEYDEASASMARQVAETAKAIAKRLDISDVVEVVEALVEPVPETVFLGRWQAITRGEVKTINVQPTGVCVFEMGDRFVRLTTPKAIKSGASVPGRWFLATKEIVMDIKDKRDKNYVYRGYLNKEGNFVVDRGVIYHQGSFHASDPRSTVFKKVY